MSNTCMYVCIYRLMDILDCRQYDKMRCDSVTHVVHAVFALGVLGYI